jgi:ABC-type uncharacterized transport system substrate-binding protein
MWRIAVALLFSLLTPLAAESQPAQKIVRIAMVYSEIRPLDDRIKRNMAALRAGLQDEGYVEGQHYRVDFHAPQNDADLARLVRALVKNNVDVISAIGAVAIREAQKATQTIPIVAHDYETDPVAAGFVAALAKPGGNITGMFLDIPEIAGKLVELLKTALPELRTITCSGIPSPGSLRSLRRTSGPSAGDRNSSPRGPCRYTGPDGPIGNRPQGSGPRPAGVPVDRG